MDITNFITWFIAEVVKMFTSIFNLLNNITFLGTSLLQVLVTILIISSLIGVILTISSPGLSFNGNRSDKVKESKRKVEVQRENVEGGKWI